MANKPISMSKIKQIIRCYCQGIGSKKTHQITGVSRNVIKLYVRKFQTLRLTLEEIEGCDDLALQQLFFPPKEATVPDEDRLTRIQALLPAISKALRRKGMTLELQWQ